MCVMTSKQEIHMRKSGDETWMQGYQLGGSREFDASERSLVDKRIHQLSYRLYAVLCKVAGPVPGSHA